MSKKQSSSRRKTKKKASRSSRREELIPPSIGKRIVTLIWNGLFYTVFISILLGALLFNFNKSPDKSFYGYRFMTVKTNSMAANPDKPELTDGFNAGDLIILKEVEPASLKVGDIITFYPIPGKIEAFLTHRIIEIGTLVTDKNGEEVEGITTQGDANSSPDIPIPKSVVVGRVISHISNVGRFIQFVRDNLVVVLSLISILFLFIATLKYYLSIPQVERPKGYRTHKNRGRSSKRKAS